MAGELIGEVTLQAPYRIYAVEGGYVSVRGETDSSGTNGGAPSSGELTRAVPTEAVERAAEALAGRTVGEHKVELALKLVAMQERWPAPDGEGTYDMLGIMAILVATGRARYNTQHSPALFEVSG